MTKNLYITTMEPRGGKSVVALGIMELLSRRLHNIGFFRPIIPDVKRDNNIELIRTRYNLKVPYEDKPTWILTNRKLETLEGANLKLLKSAVHSCSFLSLSIAKKEICFFYLRPINLFEVLPPPATPCFIA